MTKKETVTFEYNSCSECPNADTKNGKDYCVEKKRRIPDLWGEIPKWCPLEDGGYCSQHGYPLPCPKCGLGEYEVGKQDGINEVVEWIKSRMYFMEWEWGDSKGVWQFGIDDIAWREKLKEWGVK